jgi:hypothetical protein
MLQLLLFPIQMPRSFRHHHSLGVPYLNAIVQCKTQIPKIWMLDRYIFKLEKSGCKKGQALGCKLGRLQQQNPSAIASSWYPLQPSIHNHRTWTRADSPHHSVPCFTKTRTLTGERGPAESQPHSALRSSNCVSAPNSSHAGAQGSWTGYKWLWWRCRQPALPRTQRLPLPL